MSNYISTKMVVTLVVVCSSYLNYANAYQGLRVTQAVLGPEIPTNVTSNNDTTTAIETDLGIARQEAMAEPKPSEDMLSVGQTVLQAAGRRLNNDTTEVEADLLTGFQRGVVGDADDLEPVDPTRTDSHEADSLEMIEEPAPAQKYVERDTAAEVEPGFEPKAVENVDDDRIASVDEPAGESDVVISGADVVISGAF